MKVFLNLVIIGVNNIYIIIIIYDNTVGLIKPTFTQIINEVTTKFIKFLNGIIICICNVDTTKTNRNTFWPISFDIPFSYKITPWTKFLNSSITKHIQNIDIIIIINSNARRRNKRNTHGSNETTHV